MIAWQECTHLRHRVLVRLGALHRKVEPRPEALPLPRRAFPVLLLEALAQDALERVVGAAVEEQMLLRLAAVLCRHPCLVLLVLLPQHGCLARDGGGHGGEGVDLALEPGPLQMGVGVHGQQPLR